MFMMGAFNWDTFVIITKIFSIWIATVAMLIFATLLFFTLVEFTHEFGAEIFFTIGMSKTFDIDTFVSVIFASANLLVTAVQLG